MEEEPDAQGLVTPTGDIIIQIRPPPAQTDDLCLIYIRHRELCSYGARRPMTFSRPQQLVLCDIPGAQHAVKEFADVVLSALDQLEQVQGESLLRIMDILQDVSRLRPFAFTSC
jgi:hypothetical protein